jgi:hypothetical protein
MREIRLFGSEGGAPIGVPTPIKAGKLSGARIAGTVIEPPQITRTPPRFAAVGLCGDAQSWGEKPGSIANL